MICSVIMLRFFRIGSLQTGHIFTNSLHFWQMRCPCEHVYVGPSLISSLQTGQAVISLQILLFELPGCSSHVWSKIFLFLAISSVTTVGAELRVMLVEGCGGWMFGGGGGRVGGVPVSNVSLLSGVAVFCLFPLHV